MTKILVVDDAFVIREKLRNIFVKAGYEVVGEAANGLQAFQLYKKLKPDIVTMDVTMPGMSGMEGLYRIKEFDSKACVIIISSLSQKAVAIDALESGAAAFVIKPFEEEVILSVVDNVMKNFDNK